MNFRVTCAVAIAACLFGYAPAMAADLTAVSDVPNAAAPADAAAPAADDSSQSYVRTAQFVLPQPANAVQDGLHNDHRWPAMAHCINQATPADFNNCLASAFLQDGTGNSLALLPRRR
jgi:hypothetical protein